MILYPHPTDQASLDFKVQAELVRETGLRLDFRVEGSIDRLEWAEEKPRWHERLWEKSCLEAFVALPGHDAYWEWNFTPGGAWALFEFSKYRQRIAGARTDAPRFRLEREAATLVFSTRLPDPDSTLWRWALATRTPVEFSLNAILRTADDVQHFALKHAGEKPDFHLREAFSGRV